MPITVGPFYLTHPVNFPCGRKPEYPGKTHNVRQSVEFYSFHMRTGLNLHAASEVKGNSANHLATEAPIKRPKAILLNSTKYPQVKKVLNFSGDKH
jgi:hypothetical protein